MRTPALSRPRLRVASVAAAALGALALLATPTLAQADTTTPRLTAEARLAGLQPGNAKMGWRSSSVAQDQQRLSALQSGGSAQARVAAKPFVPTGVLGIDVSSYQGNVKWSSWAAKGKSFAYVKATEGTSYRNPYFKAQYDGAAKAGLIRGAYHFASPSGKSGKTQARFFVANGGGWNNAGQTLPGVLDIEYNPYGSTCYGLSKAKMVSWIDDFLVEYKKLTGKAAVIYTTTDWWTRCTGNTTKFSLTNPLWAARYGTTTPGTLPGAWTYATFWQYSSNPIDQNRFSNTAARLKVLATVS